MLCVKPRDGYGGIKRRLPLETAVELQSHAEKRHGQRGEIVVIDACIDKGSREVDLNAKMPVSALGFHRGSEPFPSHLPSVCSISVSLSWMKIDTLHSHVILDREFAAP